MHNLDIIQDSSTALVKFMSECFLCHTALEPVNDAEVEGVEICRDCCERIDTIILDYVASSPGGLDLVLDIMEDEISNPESKIRDAMKVLIKEVISEKSE